MSTHESDEKTRKLVLNRESIRYLDAQEQQDLAGGAIPDVITLTYVKSCHTLHCVTDNCPIITGW